MFLDSLDIANRALDHLGQEQIQSVTEDTKANTRTANAYDKLRRAELRRNVWRFAIRKTVLRAVDTTTLLLVPSQWAPATNYQRGSIVADANNQLWYSTQAENTGNTPGGSNSVWDAYFGPLTVSLFDSKTTYFSGELAYMLGTTPGTYQVYMSMIDGNADVPNVATPWSATTTYTNDQQVSYSGTQYRSLVPLNINIVPFSSPAQWVSSTTYSSGQQVAASDNYIYTSSANGNVGNNPVTDGGSHWTNTGTVAAWAQSGPSLTVADINWSPIASTLNPITLLYPIGTGPSSQSETRNVFRLPAGYLRQAPRDPKAGAWSFLGAPSGLGYDDWELEGNFIMSRDVGPILFRFVADITVVTKMDDMFCEGLAARIAYEVCEPLTQSLAKQDACAKAYGKFMTEARMVNGIETGPEEPPEDDYVTCRV